MFYAMPNPFHLNKMFKLKCVSERPISLEEKPYEILQQWGIHRDEVCFYIRHQEAAPLGGTNNNGKWSSDVIFSPTLI